MPKDRRYDRISLIVPRLEAKQLYLLADLSDPKGVHLFSERVQRVLLLAVRELLSRAAAEVPELQRIREQGDEAESAARARARHAELRRIEALERQQMGGAHGRRVVSDIPPPRTRAQKIDPNRIEAARLTGLRRLAEAEEARMQAHKREQHYQVAGKRAEQQGGLLSSFVQKRQQARNRIVADILKSR